ncbi:MAG: anti-sigma factor domain-containing protein [Actinomycetales bacterium]
MTHVSDDVLAAIALGDPDVDPADRAHVDSCPVCSEELAELVHVQGLLREEVGMRGAHRVEPGPELWERIAAEATGDAAVEPMQLVQPAQRADSGEPVVPAEPVQLGEPGTPVPSIAARRAAKASRPSGRSWWLVAAAAACLLLGVLVGRAVWAPTDATPPVVASVPLTTLDASKQQEGTAQLLGGQGGQGQELKVDTRPMSPGSGYVEVWLINQDGKRMVSLGILSSDQATFPVPPDAISQGYTIVDLSHEQFDDKPQHSGDSIMRGTLPV